jgi:hypothetical protein
MTMVFVKKHCDLPCSFALDPSKAYYVDAPGMLSAAIEPKLSHSGVLSVHGAPSWPLYLSYAGVAGGAVMFTVGALLWALSPQNSEMVSQRNPATGVYEYNRVSTGIPTAYPILTIAGAVALGAGIWRYINAQRSVVSDAPLRMSHGEQARK